jgi:hypothetical protein
MTGCPFCAFGVGLRGVTLNEWMVCVASCLYLHAAEEDLPMRAGESYFHWLVDRGKVTGEA